MSPEGVEAHECNAAAAVVIVTGYTRGIGKALFQGLLQRENRVRGLVGIGRSAPPESFVGENVLCIQADVSRMSEVEAAVCQTLDKFGRVTALVNNAGICPYTPVLAANNADWIETLSINLVGAYFCIHAALPAIMRSGQAGRVINILSGGSISAPPGFSAYNASKAGLAVLTRTLPKEIAQDNVRIYGYIPGNVRTDMNPEGNRAPTEAAKDIETLLFESGRVSGTVFSPEGIDCSWEPKTPEEIRS